MNTTHTDFERANPAMGYRAKLITNPRRNGCTVRQFNVQAIARMFDLPLRILQPAPWKANKRRYVR